MPASRFQDRFVFAALVLTLLLAVLLGANALVVARYHRSVAEGVLRDYADYAASELANRVQGGLAQRIFPILSAVMSSRTLASAAALRASADTSFWRIAEPGLSWFRLRPNDSRDFAGAPLDEKTRAAVVSAVEKARPSFPAQTYLMLRWDSALAGKTMALMPGSDGMVAGLLLPVDAVTTTIRAAVSKAPLLPPSLTGGRRHDSAVTFEVRAPSGVVVASDRMSTSVFRGTRTLASTWGGLEIVVALEESVAGRLVIGGLPRSRLPVVGALLGLTVLLIAAAWIQLGRQREFARQRDEFVAGVSHELRTPLAQIRLFTETLRLGRVRSDAERDQSLTIIDRESRRLTWMVENLLAVSRVSRGVLTVSPRELDLAAELREAIEGFGPLAASRGASLEVSAPETLRARADGEAFRQIVLNLLDNAVKYGPEGQTIRVSLDRSGDLAEIVVEDQGSGVPDA